MQLTLFFCYFSPPSRDDLALRVLEFDSLTASSSRNIWGGVSSSYQSLRLLVLLCSPLIYHLPVNTTEALTPTAHQHTTPVARSRSFMTPLGSCLLFLARVSDITSWKKWRHWEKNLTTYGPHGKSVNTETRILTCKKPHEWILNLSKGDGDMTGDHEATTRIICCALWPFRLTSITHTLPVDVATFPPSTLPETLTQWKLWLLRWLPD